MALIAVRAGKLKKLSWQHLHAATTEENAVLVRHSVFPPIRRMRAWGGWVHRRRVTARDAWIV